MMPVMPVLNAAIPPFEDDPFFTCKCNPPDNREGYAHRVPIDCMTAEDWQRVARERQTRATTVTVVSVVGDQDCGWPNEGGIGVFEKMSDAWGLAISRAREVVEEMSDEHIEMRDHQIELGRAVIYVTEMEVQ